MLLRMVGEKFEVCNPGNRIRHFQEVGVPYGNRTRVAAVKEKRFVGIQKKPAAWIAPSGSQRYSKSSLLDP